jgi:unsaturated chondroitin disaccharide hydrolase
MVPMTHNDLQAALTGSLERIQRCQGAFDRRFPTVGEGNRYQLAGNNHWLAGFWTGLLWLTYAVTGDRVVQDRAQSSLSSFAERLEGGIHITHDLGFLYSLSARAQWQLTGGLAARDLALRAAQELARRYRPQGGYIQAWGQMGDPAEGGRAIIDTMMNLPLLFWACQQTGDLGFREMALAHAETTRKHLLRSDGASYHTFFFDQDTGRPIGPRTHQGYADDSLWARGQAWAIYGFALAAEWSGEQRFLEAAQGAARRFMAELPADGVPTWDLRLPAEAPHYRDSSAGAVAAGGMLRLARLGEEGGEGEFRQAAGELLSALVAHCLETRAEGQGLLRHGTYNVQEGRGVDAYFICGDYFFLEALLALEGRAPDFWGPGGREL